MISNRENHQRVIKVRGEERAACRESAVIRLQLLGYYLLDLIKKLYPLNVSYNIKLTRKYEVIFGP